MSTKLSIQLLGDFHFVYDGQTIESFGAPRLQSVLTYLILHRDIPQPRRHLAFVLWPDSNEAAARNNLRQLIYQLRQVLPEPNRFLSSDANTIGWKLDEDQIIDVVMLDKYLEQAATSEKQENPDLLRYALEQTAISFHGVLLPGCYEEWILPERERIHNMSVMALQKLISLQEDQRDYTAAIHIGQMLLHLDPLDENIYYLMMRLHRKNYDIAGAMRIYQTAEKTLESELGIRPGQLLQKSFEQIRNKVMMENDNNRTINPRQMQSFVGRQAEWQRLNKAWQRSANGSTNLVILSGEAGIGKTRLAEEMLVWADEQDIITARARAYGVEGQLTMAPVTEWLRDDHFQAGFVDLEPIWLVEISRLLPELRLNNSKLPKPEIIPDFGQRQRFFEALARTILLPNHPTLLMIDDIQWCDQETIEWLHFLLRFNPQAPLLILGTLRSEETHPALARLFQQLQTSEILTDIELQSLDASETAKLAGQSVGEELSLNKAMQLYRETEGNPLFIIEMMNAGFREWLANDEMKPSSEVLPFVLPPRMQAVILQRLVQLSPSARRAAEIGAVFGRPFSLNLLLQVSHEEEDVLVGALDELWQKRMISEKAANTYEYTHDKLREVTYNELSAPQRRLLHRRLAEALETIYAGDLEQVNGQIAVHYDRAGVSEKAIPFYTVAGSTAASVYANEDAITLLKRGLDLLQKDPTSTIHSCQELDLLLAIIPSYRSTKGWTAPELGQALNRALILCDQVGTHSQRAQILYGLQSVYVVEGELEKVQNSYDEMRYLFLQTQGSLPQFAGLMYTGARLHMGKFLEARTAFEEIMANHDEDQIRDLQASQGVNYLAHAHVWNSHALWFLGFPESAQQCALDGVQIAARYTQPFNQALTATYFAMLQELRADSNGFRTQAEEALRLAQEVRAPYYQYWAQILVCFADTCDQPSANNLICLEDAIHAFMATGARLRLPYYMSLLARAYHQSGATEKALIVVEQALNEGRKSHEFCWDSKLYRLRGEFLHFQTSNGVETLSNAESALMQSLDIAKSQKTLTYELRASVSLARLWKDQQRSTEGKRLLTPILERIIEGCDSPDIHSAQCLVEVPD